MSLAWSTFHQFQLVCAFFCINTALSLCLSRKQIRLLQCFILLLLVNGSFKKCAEHSDPGIAISMFCLFWKIFLASQNISAAFLDIRKMYVVRFCPNHLILSHPYFGRDPCCHLWCTVDKINAKKGWTSSISLIILFHLSSLFVVA